MEIQRTMQCCFATCFWVSDLMPMFALEPIVKVLTHGSWLDSHQMLKESSTLIFGRAWQGQSWQVMTRECIASTELSDAYSVTNASSQTFSPMIELSILSGTLKISICGKQCLRSISTHWLQIQPSAISCQATTSILQTRRKCLRASLSKRWAV